MRILTRDEDLAYARSQFRVIGEVDFRLPAPAYYDEDGHAFVPYDYEAQEADRDRFILRVQAKIGELNAGYDFGWIAEAWSAYIDGIYGICLKVASPENIVEKNWLIGQIESALRASNPNEGDWLAGLLAHVDRLDELERPFCAFDREYFGRPVSRDTYITAVRRKYRFPAPR